MNFPVLTSIKYQTDFSDHLGLFGVFSASINLIKAGNRRVKAGAETWEIEYDIYPSFGFSVGGGFVMNEQFSIGFRYFGLGEPELEGTITDPFIIYKDKKLAVIAITCV